MIGSFLSRGPALLYSFQIVTVFGMLQMIPSGGVNFLPGSICAGLLAVKILLQPGNLVRAANLVVDPARAGLFAAFIVYALATCFVLPRMFAGQIVIVPINGIGANFVTPSTANVTQPLYFLLSFLTTLTVAVAISNRTFERQYLRAVLAGGAAIVLTGLVDIVLYRTGHSGLLDVFKTASYRNLTDSEVAGAKRVVGLTPEASAYGALCIGALTTLVFLRPFYEDRARRLYVPLMSVALVVMALLSTSSNAYLGLTVFVALYGLDGLVRLASVYPVLKEGLWLEFTLLACGLLAVLAVVVFAPELLAPVQQVFDMMVLKKSASASFAERSLWNRIGLQAFFDSGAMGVGLGSMRTSNWFISILGSTGLIGAVLLFGFIAYLLFWPNRPTSPRRGQMLRAVRFALLPTLVMSAMGGTIPDIGVHTSSLYGLLLGLRALPRRQERWPARARQPDGAATAEPSGLRVDPAGGPRGF